RFILHVSLLVGSIGSAKSADLATNKIIQLLDHAVTRQDLESALRDEFGAFRIPQEPPTEILFSQVKKYSEKIHLGVTDDPLGSEFLSVHGLHDLQSALAQNVQSAGVYQEFLNKLHSQDEKTTSLDMRWLRYWLRLLIGRLELENGPEVAQKRYDQALRAISH